MEYINEGINAHFVYSARHKTSFIVIGLIYSRCYFLKLLEFLKSTVFHSMAMLTSSASRNF